MTDYRNHPNPKIRAQIEAQIGKTPARAKRSKERNTPTVRDGIRFDSKLEADYYDYLRALRAAGTVRYFHRQVPIELTAGVTYRVDFLVFWADGRVTYDDPKGRLTPTFRLKRKQAEALYPITIRIIKSGDFPVLRP